jgi:hypothetical protein
MSDEQQLFGWGKQGHAYHFFRGERSQCLLESVCGVYYSIPWFWYPGDPLDANRNRYADGNCVGCQAWLSIPMNRAKCGLVAV